MTTSKNLRVCTFNVCLVLKCKLNLIKQFLNEYHLDIICIQEADIITDEDLQIYQISGYILECEKAQDDQKVWTVVYVRNNIKFRRHIDLEQAEAHIILLSITGKEFGITAIYRTYKLTHKQTYEEAIDEQIAIIKSFTATQKNVIITGDLNLDYNKRTDQSYQEEEYMTNG